MSIEEYLSSLVDPADGKHFENERIRENRDRIDEFVQEDDLEYILHTIDNLDRTMGLEGVSPMFHDFVF